MSSLSVSVRYRPIRLGFCVQKGDLNGLERALRLTHTLWGGRFNPIVPVAPPGESNELAKALIEAFHVDALYPASNAEPIRQFIESYRYLPWPNFERELFVASARGRIASFLDVYHPLGAVFEEHIKDKPEPRVASILYEWDVADPLRYVLLATFGAYPSRDDIGKDYADFFVTNLRGKRVALAANDPLPEDSYKAFTPSVLSVFNLDWSGWSSRGNPGFYVGDSGNFDDILDYWNLRAAKVDLFFFDLAHRARLMPIKDALMQVLQRRPADPVGWLDSIAFWSRLREIPAGLGLPPRAIWSFSNPGIWNGLNLNPPSIYINEQSVLANVNGSEESRPSISFQLPKKPFFDPPELYGQSVVVSLRPIVDLSGHEDCTLTPPYIPELNQYYTSKATFGTTGLRSEPDGRLAVFTDVRTSDLTIQAIPTRDLIVQIFKILGMKLEPSQPGLVASRLIRQMGGLQGCRVFKITGVRNLINKYGPMTSFTKGSAIQAIGQNDAVTGQPNFANFAKLYIEQRNVPDLKPEQAFTFLTRKGVFRAGLKLKCPNCHLDSWVSLDDIASEVQCELCGNWFQITDQLHDRDWAYRRSGLFGREDHQQGSIPVAITLQQIDTLLSPDMIYSTAMSIAPLTADIARCETDFVIISQRHYERRTPLAIGECKSNGEITAQDVQNLTRVADALDGDRVEPFIIFAKTSPFTQEEIERCRTAQPEHRFRAILLSDRELEPYFVYERTETEFDIRSSAISLEDLARATDSIYFHPRRRQQQPAAPAPNNA
jgi:hypothetical protein